MAKYPGSVTVTGFIAPTDTSDTYATHDALLGKGGLREVQTLIDRDEIPTDRRRIGMLVYVIEEEKYYALFGDITNLSWKDCGSQLGGYDDLLAEIQALEKEIARVEDDLKKEIVRIDDEMVEVDERLDALESIEPVYEISISCSGTLAQGELLYIAPLPYDLTALPDGNFLATCLTSADCTLSIAVDKTVIGQVIFLPNALTGTVVIAKETPLNKNSIITIYAPQTVTELADVGVHLTFTIRENV